MDSSNDSSEMDRANYRFVAPDGTAFSAWTSDRGYSVPDGSPTTTTPSAIAGDPVISREAENSQIFAPVFRSST